MKKLFKGRYLEKPATWHLIINNALLGAAGTCGGVIEDLSRQGLQVMVQSEKIPVIARSLFEISFH